MSAPRRDTRFVVVYRLDVPDETRIVDLRRQHRLRGYFDVRYHFVLPRDGSVESGRPPASCACHHDPKRNRDSVAVAIIGKEPNDAQFQALHDVLQAIKSVYPTATQLET